MTNKEIDKIYLGSQEVNKVYLGSTVVYNSTPPIDYKSMPLTFEIMTPGKICFKRTGTTIEDKTIQYSINDEEWTSITSNTEGTEIYVDAGDIIQFKGDNAGYGDDVTVYPGTAKNSYCSFSGTTAIYKAYGNIMSLINSTGFTSATTLTEKFSFRRFFAYTNLVDIENLVLPATTLTENCYSGMFSNCTGLTTAPSELPATTMAASGYSFMFERTQLTELPELPATTLANGCYDYMFQGCTSLATAPANLLPVTDLTDAGGCYYGMFSGCTGLTTAPALPATTLASNCYYGMFGGCTSLTTAPELPAPTLVNGCYQLMFSRCPSLNYIKCLATTNVTTANTNSWTNGVAASGTFVKATEMTGWTTGVNGIPSGWTVEEE